MRQISTHSRSIFSYVTHMLASPKLSKGCTAWIIIALMVVLFLLPYAIPGRTYLSMTSYPVFSLIPQITGALLRQRKGSLLAWLLLTIGLTSKVICDMGLFWPPALVINLTVGTVGGLCFSLAAGQFAYMSRQLSVAHAAIQKQALTDALTNLPNHRAVMEQLDKEFERARRFGRPLSVLFFDGDRFKRVNDTYGHAVGDAVLRQLGERATSVLRGGDTLGRFGGEEFVVLLPETDTEQASAVAERIRASVAALPVATLLVEAGVNATVSMGIATYPTHGTSINEVLEKADQAMYWAKKLGRNQVRTITEAERARHNPVFNVLLTTQENREEGTPDGYSLPHAQRIQQLGPMYSLMRLVELRDSSMSAHSHAVSDLATAIAKEMRLDAEDILAVSTAGLLHDIGKVAIPDVLLKKEGHLSSSERDIIRQHPDFGAQILEESPLLHDLMPAIRHHHERWDGKGYPDRLIGEEIPLPARIIAVAEAYHAMTTQRPYQASRPVSAALAELQRCAATQFDPTVVRAIQMVVTRQQEEIALSQLPLVS